MSKSRSPGYQGGNEWVIDDMKGRAYRRSETRYRWDGVLMHEEDWESRHPQDFVRSRKDKITPAQPIRPDEAFGTEEYTSITYAQAKDTIPPGTNNGEL